MAKFTLYISCSFLAPSPDDTANHENAYGSGEDDGESKNDGRFCAGVDGGHIVPAGGEYGSVKVEGGGS